MGLFPDRLAYHRCSDDYMGSLRLYRIPADGKKARIISANQKLFFAMVITFPNNGAPILDSITYRGKYPVQGLPIYCPLIDGSNLMVGE